MTHFSYFHQNDELKLFNLDSKWLSRFLSLAMDVSSWSKDPSSKVGAVLINSDKKVIGVGYNGLSRQYSSKDEQKILQDRNLKYPRIIHAEPNCISNTEQRITSDDVMFITHQPCVGCINKMTQAGIRKIIFKYDEYVAQRFDFQESINELERLNVEYYYFDDFEYINNPQDIIYEWCKETFGPLATDTEERMMRFMEEAIELSQAEGLDKDLIHNMVDHVYSRPADTSENEIGGTTVTLMCYLYSKGCSINNVAINEYKNKLRHISPDDMKKRHERKVENGFGKKY
ncbi:dCMP deaminase-like protein [Salicola phage SCTP-2]|nr:dCMP deaminase-like protein [Salicola phage SCTP-2]